MNIFFLDKDPSLAARYQCDKHVVKMVLESAQILSSVHRLSGSNDQALYSLTHQNHPCVLWVIESEAHYKWLLKHYIALCSEYTYRYQKLHKSEMLCGILSNVPKALANTTFSWTLKVTDNDIKDVVASYQQYYINKSKVMKMTWINREIPHFMSKIHK
ncbi:pyrimidine dimer DNA glycosylase/endonuclease V [Fastidiosibacter lacustris]|uniref:pyrimidine dimer DNA glycosylase/endonuclease V n=1 Tax=Fastidiosibacter lacustris TaxID=2056695 RepID=UPI000E34DE18|nr:pyrimidine dimer DNA glycosylase/endonuclease V [Fastidiosibacter lacustris]